jgi:60 kDa SS-A/Ro ribonucleoprotein
MEVQPMNKNLFSQRGVRKRTPRPNTHNEAGGQAYSLDDKAALAQYVVTGTFNNVYYTTAGEQLKLIEKLASRVDPRFIAKLAVYGREVAHMKDTPAYLLASLAAQGEVRLVEQIFDRICINSKMLLNFAGLIRSGVLGRRSFGTVTKRCIQRWLQDRSGKKLYIASVGHSNPSLADLIKMVHPRPTDREQQAMFSYLIGKLKSEDWEYLPDDVKQFELLKEVELVGDDYEIPDIPFRALTNLNLGVEAWREIARNMPWGTLRQNLNMLAKRNVFDSDTFVREMAAKLSDEDAVRQFNAFPYQLMTTYQNVTFSQALSNALQDAMEVAVENVPEFPGRTVVAVDVSGSMSSAITGRRPGATSKTIALTWPLCLP